MKVRELSTSLRYAALDPVECYIRHSTARALAAGASVLHRALMLDHGGRAGEGVEYYLQHPGQDHRQCGAATDGCQEIHSERDSPPQNFRLHPRCHTTKTQPSHPTDLAEKPHTLLYEWFRERSYAQEGGPSSCTRKLRCPRSLSSSSSTSQLPRR
eukprot:3930658-Rhodomonas_salina.2